MTTIPGFGPRSPANFKCLKWSLRSTAILQGLVESRITDPCCAELMRNFPSYAKIAQRLRPAARSSSGRDGCQWPGQNTFTENDSSRPRSSPLGVLSTKSGSEKEARLSASLLSKASEQEGIALSRSSIREVSEELAGAMPGTRRCVPDRSLRSVALRGFRGPRRHTLWR